MCKKSMGSREEVEPAPEYREIPKKRSGDTMRTGRRSVDGNLYKRYNTNERPIE